MKPSPQYPALFAFLVLCLLVGAVGGAVTATSVGTWYATLVKPSFNPPNAVFGPVWTTLYVLIAVAGWRLWRLRASLFARRALVGWAVQLVLNLLWSCLFFGARWIGGALVEVLVLLCAIVVTALLAWRVDRWAGALFVPYIAWVSFATVLNAALFWLN